VLFAGPSASGKSTAALACLRAGFDFLGEDGIGLELGGDRRAYGHRLYASAMVTQDQLRRFPELIPLARPGRHQFETKLLVLLGDLPGARLERRCRIDAIVCPRLTPARGSQRAPATKAEALLALAPSSLLTRPGAGRRGFDRLVALVESVACHHLNLGTDPDLAADRIAELLEESSQ
jgi:hypothetical protein